MSVPCPYIVSIYETVPKYLGGTYEIRMLGFGKPTLAEAQSEAQREVAFWTERTGRAHRAEIRLFCETCHAHGVAPGFRRKPCPACGGEGTTAIDGGAR